MIEDLLKDLPKELYVNFGENHVVSSREYFNGDSIVVYIEQINNELYYSDGGLTIEYFNSHDINSWMTYSSIQKIMNFSGLDIHGDNHVLKVGDKPIVSFLNFCDTLIRINSLSIPYLFSCPETALMDIETVANYVIKYCVKNNKDICKYKLQCLLYYIQAYVLSVMDKLIFKDDFEANMFCPFAKTIYNKYKKYNHFENIEEFRDVDIEDDHLKKLVDQILLRYGNWGFISLQEAIKNEYPYAVAGKGGIIDKKHVRDYYRSLI